MITRRSYVFPIDWWQRRDPSVMYNTLLPWKQIIVILMGSIQPSFESLEVRVYMFGTLLIHILSDRMTVIDWLAVRYSICYLGWSAMCSTNGWQWCCDGRGQLCPSLRPGEQAEHSFVARSRPSARRLVGQPSARRPAGRMRSDSLSSLTVSDTSATLRSFWKVRHLQYGPDKIRALKITVSQIMVCPRFRDFLTIFAKCVPGKTKSCWG